MYYDREEIKSVKKLIEDTIREASNESDRAYAMGLIEMAYHLGAIKLEEQLRYKGILYL